MGQGSIAGGLEQIQAGKAADAHAEFNGKQLRDAVTLETAAIRRAAHSGDM